MLTKKRAYKLSITLITFLFGAAFQFLLAQWLPSGDVIPLLSMLILVSLVLILIISSDVSSALEHVIDLASRSGIRVEYIEDDRNGRSYRRSSELIKKASKRITIVSPWEPFAEYQDSDAFTELKSYRHEYYEELISQINLHIHHVLFHKRSIQT